MNSTKGNNKDDKSYNMNCTKKLHHLLNSAERKYYHDLLIEHRKNIYKVLESHQICDKQKEV